MAPFVLRLGPIPAKSESPVTLHPHPNLPPPHGLTGTSTPPPNSPPRTLALKTKPVSRTKPTPKPLFLTPDPAPVHLSARKLEANRENAQLSTGPVTEAGKAISAQNNFRHGLTGAFCLLPDESQDEFNTLHANLSEEHQPATQTESMLVNDMARHYWLYQRALRLQETCFASDLTAGATQNQLSLFLRYGTTHERAIRRSLADLLKLRKERLRLERGFESQARERAAELRRETRENRLAAVEKRTAEAYEKEKNKPETEFDIINEYFREENVRDLREALMPKPKGKKRAA